MTGGGTTTGAPPSGSATGAEPPDVAVPPVAVPPDTAVPTFEATQVHTEGQSVFTAQVVALGWQLPGKDVMVWQVTGVRVPASMATGNGAGTPVDPLPPPVPAEAVPVPPFGAEPDEPEQMPITLGWQVKPAPQSASALHGSCHL